MTFIRENVSLAPYTTIRVGGSARYFFSVYTDNEVREAVRFAHAKNLPFFILGGGSNVIFLDEGFAGVIIKIKIPFFSKYFSVSSVVAKNSGRKKEGPLSSATFFRLKFSFLTSLFDRSSSVAETTSARIFLFRE